MSIALYQQRLYWDGRHGSARHGGAMRTLHRPPVLPGTLTPLEAIDYAPEVHLAQLREPLGEWRDMTAAEVAAAEALLAELNDPDEAAPAQAWSTSH